MVASAPPSTTPLTQRSAVALAAAIRAGELSSREVVEAHIEVLRRMQERTHAVAADRFEEALREADAADARLAEGEEVGPLHGVPCTVKESIALKGMPQSAGLVARRDVRAEEDAPSVARLRAAGAIPLAVTNTSEMTMWIESSNHVYGRSSSAYDAGRTAGGSSGGEGAAVGSGGSPVGLGSDIGGSVRLPAFFNGVFGHKPSCGVIPNTGQFPVADGEAARMLTQGPLVRRAEDLMPVLRVLAGPDGVDPIATDIDLGDPDAVSLEGLNVVVTEKGWFWPVSRDLREAREAAADALAARGARVRREDLKGLRRAVELFLVALKEGSPASFAEVLADAGVENVSLRRAMGGAVRGTGPHTWPTLILLAFEKVSDRIPDAQVRRAQAAAKSLADEVEDVMRDGVLLHPPHATVAPKHGRTIGRAWRLSPTAAFNLLQMPVTQVPLGLDRRGLPLGRAGRGRARGRPRGHRLRPRAGARDGRLGPARRVTSGPVDRDTISSITHGDLRFANPLSAATVDEAIAALKLPPGATAIDVGCGNGEVLARVKQHHDVHDDGDRAVAALGGDRARAGRHRPHGAGSSRSRRWRARGTSSSASPPRTRSAPGSRRSTACAAWPAPARPGWWGRASGAAGRRTPTSACSAARARTSCPTASACTRGRWPPAGRSSTSASRPTRTGPPTRSS